MPWRLLTICQKEFRQMRRDPVTQTNLIIIPLLMLLIYGYAISTDVKHLPLATYDQDHTSLSRDFARSLSHSEYFDLVGQVTSYQQLRHWIDRGRIKVALVIPRHFTRDLLAQRGTTVQLIVDGSDSNTANLALNYAMQMTRQYAIARTLEQVNQKAPLRLETIPPIEMRTRILYNPQQLSINYLVPGIIALIIMMIASVVTASAIVRERERGTMEQLLVSPIRRLELMLGKLIPYIVVVLAEVILIILASTLIFKVPIKGNLFELFFLAGLFLIAGLGIGLLISTISRSQQTAANLAFLTTMLPTVYLSGFIFPISSMPPFLQVIAAINPSKYFLVILRSEFLKGVGLPILWPEAIFLAAFGSIMLVISTLRFKKQL